MRIGRRCVSLAVATALAVLPACQKKEEKSDTGAAASAGEAKSAPDKPDGDEKGAGGSQAKPPTEPVVEGSVAYPAALDDLLNLVPAGETTFVAVRDPNAVVALFGTFVADQVKGLAPLAKTAEPELGAKLEESAGIYAKLGVELAKGVINLDKGFVFIKSSEAVIYGANDPNALPNLLRTLGAEDVPKHCAAIAAAPGYAACGDDEAKVKALVPGKKAAEHRAAIVAALPGFDVERGNFVGQITDDKTIRFALATPPGSMHLAVGLGDVVAEQAEMLAVGKPTALGLADPSAAFLWAKLDTKALEPTFQGMGPPVTTVGATFAGEVYVGGVQGGVPLAILLGVTDPYPAAGMISLASAMLDQVPKQLPDGTKVEVKIDKMQAGGKEVSVLHGKLSGSQQVEKLAEVGVKAEAFAFAAGKFAGAVIGSDDTAVKTIAEFDGAGPGKPLLERLPPALATTLEEGTATWAFHLPLDGLQAPQMQAQLTEGVAMIPESERSGLPADAFANALLSVVAPLSSVSAWMTHPENARVLHVAVVGFADDTTPKGKAAREAVAKVTAGGDRKATYAALAAEHPDARFDARAGDDPNALRSAISGAFMLGVMAAVAMRPMDVKSESSASAPPMPMPIEPPPPPEPPAAPLPP
jgi:hypothetical protein